jgi:hypothetical protein
LALVATAGSAHAATFTFNNALANGLWFSEVQSGPTWTNNWGQSGGAPGLPTPGAADTANLTGAVNGNGVLNVAVLNIPSGASLNLTGASLTATTLSNSGNLGFNAGSKTFAGSWTNTSTGTFTWGDGGGWSPGATGLTLGNAGTFNLPGSSTIAGGTYINTGTMNKLGGGTIAINTPTVTASSGMIMSSSGTLQLNSPTVTSNPAATWVTTAGNIIRMTNSTLSGTFVGNHAGLGSIAGSATLTGNLTLANTGAGTQPWVREAGATNTGLFTLTNNGQLALGAGNHTLSGALSNSGVMTLDAGGWTYGLAAGTTLNNAGTLNLPGGSVINGAGAGAGTVITTTGSVNKTAGSTTTINALVLNVNSGVINATSGSITINSSTVNSGPSAAWNSAGNGAINLSSCTISGTFNSGGAYSNLNSPTLAANTTLTGPATAGWNINGTIAGAFTLTNAGRAYLSVASGNNAIVNTAINNALGATLFISQGGGWTTSGNNSTWTNAGTISIPGSTNINRDVNPFVLINNGTISRDSGGTAAFNSLNFTNNQVFSHVATGAGASNFNSCTVVAGPASSFVIPSGSLTFNNCIVSGNFGANLNGGSGRFVSPTFAAGSTLNASGAEPWNLENTITVTGGGTIVSNGALALAKNGGNPTLVGQITSNGPSMISQGGGWTVTLDNGRYVNNATVSVPGALNINKGTGSAEFVNAGTLARTGGGNLALNNLVFSHTGSLTHDTNNPSTNFNSCNVQFGPGSSFTIPTGGIAWSNSTLAGPLTVALGPTATATISNASLSGNVSLTTTGNSINIGTTNAGTFTMTNAALAGLALTGGNPTLTGSFVNNAAATWTFSNGSGWTIFFDGATFNNNGTVNVPGSLSLTKGTGSATLNNTGTINRSGASTFGVNSITFNNSGLYAQPAGSNGTTTFNNSTITQTGAGTLRVTSGSRLTFLNASRDITGGRLEGSGLINANGMMNPSNLTIAPGDANPAVGTLTMDGGSLTLNAGDALEVSIDRPGGNPPQVADQLRTTLFNTTVNITGADLIVRRPSPTYTPDFNVEYVIIDVQGGGTLTGTFANVIEANPLADYGYRLTYTPTQVRMKIVRKCNISDVAGGNQVQLFDGQATADDIIVFLNWFFANDLRADFAGPNQSPTPDGVLTADDIIRFLNFYFAGCGF